MNLIEPIDQLHADCLEDQQTIRAMARAFQAEAAEWTPSPPPPKETPQ